MLIWGIWGFLVEAVISLISLMNATLACDYPALTLYESIRDEILPVIKKKMKSSTLFLHIILQENTINLISLPLCFYDI